MTRGRWSRVHVPVLAAAVVLAAAATSAASGSSAATQWIVFSAHPGGAGAAQLFRVQPSGVGLAQITKGDLPAVAPDYSPNGTRIAFSRLGSGLFTMNIDGTGMRRLTSEARDSYPSYSPDGKQIVFLRLYRTNWRVYTMTVAGKDVRRLPQSPPAGRPTWTADGKSILIPATGDLVKIDVQTGRVMKYFGMTIDIQIAQTATVSPDGKTLAYVGPRRSTGPPDCGEGRCPQFGLYLASINAPHRPRRIVNDTGAAGWSGDGKTLAFVAKGTLTLRVVGSGVETRISTGTNVADGDAPPAWPPS